MVIIGFRSRFGRAPDPGRPEWWTSAEAALLTSTVVGVKLGFRVTTRDHAPAWPSVGRTPVLARRVGLRVEFSILRSAVCCRFLPFHASSVIKACESYSLSCGSAGSAAFPALASPRHRLASFCWRQQNGRPARKKPQNARFRPIRQKSDALQAPWCPFD